MRHNFNFSKAEYPSKHTKEHEHKTPHVPHVFIVGHYQILSV